LNTEITSFVRDVVVGISAAIVAIGAIYGLGKWRKELTGKAKFDIARNVMLLAFRLNADFQSVRNPFTFASEYADRPRQQNESSKESEVLDNWYAKRRRLQPLVEHLAKFQEVSWEAKIILGEDRSESVSDAFKVFKESYAELSSSIDAYFETRRQEGLSNSVYHDQDWLKDLHRLIHSIKDDDFSKQIDTAIEQLDLALKVYVK
jgi:hypothetical protein